MALKYLDSKRIRGSSANPATPLHDIDFTEYANQSAGEAAWISSSTSGSNGYMIYDHTNKNLDCRNQGSSAGAKICYYDLGASVNATDWRIRFRYNSSSFSAESTGGKSYYTGFSISNAYDTADTGSPDWFGLKFIADAGSAQSQFYGTDGGSQSGTTMSFSPTSNSGVNDVFVEWHFVSGTCTCKFFTDSDYDTQISGSATVTKSTSVAGLRYFMVYLRQDNGGNGDNEFVVDDFEFINGTESTDEKATLVTAAVVTTHYLGHNEDNMAQNGVMGVAVNSGSSLIGKEITKVSFWARYINGATNGTLYCRAWDSSGNVPSTVAKNFGSIDGSTLTSSMAKYTFTIDSGTYTIAQNSHIGLEYSGSANNVEILGQNSGGAYGTWFEYDGSYSGSNGTKTPNIEVTESATSDLPENTLFEETDTYKTYWLQSNAWTINDPTRGVACMGDNNGNSEVYDFVTIATLGNATDFGNCTSPPRFDPAACADATRGVCFGGGISASQNIIEYITVATEGNATDFGDMTAATRHNTGMADATYGLSTGGYTSSVVNSIDYVTIQTLGNAADFGNLSDNTRSHGSCADATRGLVMSGYRSALTLSITYLTIASTGNSTTFGDVTVARQSAAGCADATRGICGGGVNGSQMNIIDYVTIQSTGNATDFGDLTVNKSECAAYANALRGCFAGGNTGSITDVIEYVTIQTLGNAADFGDSTEARRGCEGLAA